MAGDRGDSGWEAHDGAPAREPRHRRRLLTLALGTVVLVTGLPTAATAAAPDASGPPAAPTQVTADQTGGIAPPGSATTQAAWVTAAPLDLDGGSTFIGQASNGSMTYAGLSFPDGDTPEAKDLRKQVAGLDRKLRAAFDAYTKAQEEQAAAEQHLVEVQAELEAARQRRDAAQAIVDLFVRSAYVGDPSAAGTAELNLLLSKKGPDALHAASLLRYGGQSNARALDLLKDTEERVAALQREAEAGLAERRRVATEMSDQLASIRVQLNEIEILLGEEAASQVAAGLGQVPGPVVSAAVTGGEVAPFAQRAASYVLLDGVPRRALDDLANLGVPMTVAWFGKATLGGRSISVVGIDPNSARTFSAAGMAENDDLWRVVARDEAMASHSLTAAAHLALGQPVTVEASGGASTDVRLGALATLGWPESDLVVSAARAQALGASTRRVLMSTDGTTSEEITARVRAVAGASVKVTNAGSMAPPASAFLPGRAATAAFGTMRYQPNANGTVAPDPGWVARNIVTTTVPILGRVTCHRLMVPQLRGALTEVAQAGLAAAIHKDQYAGCYYPRYIEYSAGRGLSLHTWGVAIDMNVPGNQRGTSGEFDRRVVSIFKRWGFRWGGDWSYTDPMHFELGALLRQ